MKNIADASTKHAAEVIESKGGAGSNERLYEMALALDEMCFIAKELIAEIERRDNIGDSTNNT
jgi:hypothetical protein|tara:strand:+ start:231 stop:419 length:189 start_codon:yes stop_codon:yes gene_type:complete